MRKLGLSLCLLIILTSCTNLPFATPTITPTTTLIPTKTSTPTLTATPTITPTPTPTYPSRWDDPEVFASIRSDFVKKTGMSVEDYFVKAVEEKRVNIGSASDYFDVESYARKFVTVWLGSLGLGTRIIEPENGTKRYLVMYVARYNNNDEVGIYPINVAVEENGHYAQTNVYTIPIVLNEPDKYRYEFPLNFHSISEAQNALDPVVTGIRISFFIIVRFKDLESCSIPQYDHYPIYNVSDDYWEFVGDICHTSGNYINTASQEKISFRNGGYMAQTYNLDLLMKQGVPEGGFIPIELYTNIPQQ